MTEEQTTLDMGPGLLQQTPDGFVIFDRETNKYVVVDLSPVQALYVASWFRSLSKHIKKNARRFGDE